MALRRVSLILIALSCFCLAPRANAESPEFIVAFKQLQTSQQQQKSQLQRSSRSYRTPKRGQTQTLSAGETYLQDSGLSIVKELPLRNTFVVTVSNLRQVMQFVRREYDNFEYVEQNKYLQLKLPPPGDDLLDSELLAADANDSDWGPRGLMPNNDPLDNNWGLDPFWGSNARDAWDTTTGDSSVAIAFLGTGIQPHPDLTPNLFQDSASTFASIKESVAGFNVYNTTVRNPPNDDHGIGNHAAGVAGAKGNNGIGVAGVAWDVTLIPVKIARSPDGTSVSTSISNVVEGIDYVIRKKQAGVNVVAIHSLFNFTGDLSNALRNKIIEAGDNEILFITAAGDSALNLNSATSIPGGLVLPNLISVASYYGYYNPAAPPLFSSVDFSPFSNYGLNAVQLAAPGEIIQSCWINNGYQIFAGTTDSAAYVAGAAALLKSQAPSLTMAQLKSTILDNVRVYPALSNRVSTSGVLDINQALNGLPARYPGDYDQDGDVDGADYLVWQRSFGQSGPNLPADGNGDGIVNAADYTVWRDNYGAGT